MQTLKSFAIAVIASAAFAGAAYAREAVFTAKIEAPVAETTRYIASNTIWTCEGDTCRARPNHGASVRACRQFVRESGARVISYGPEGGELSADEIARCNGQEVAQTASN
jgi:hypothetical protein